jgi:arginase family enzyme
MSGIKAVYPQSHWVWIDAHADLHLTPASETSIMPLSAALGEDI